MWYLLTSHYVYTHVYVKHIILLYCNIENIFLVEIVEEIFEEYYNSYCNIVTS